MCTPYALLPKSSHISPVLILLMKEQDRENYTRSVSYQSMYKR